MTGGSWPPPQGRGPGTPWPPPAAPQRWAAPRQAWGPRHAASGPPPMRYLPPPPPRRSGSGVVLLLVLVLAGVGLFAAAALFGAVADVASPEPPVVVGTEPPSPEAQPTPVPPSSRPSAVPEPAESAPEPRGPADQVGLPAREWPALPAPTSTDPDWVTLQRSALYGVAVPELIGCPPPAEVLTLAELESAALAQTACIQAAWKPTLASLGYSTQDVPVFIFAGDRVETPCGEVTAPALYCSAQGGSIYFGETTLNGAAWHDFGVKDMAGHEYGHHLQSEAGMFLAEYSVGGSNESARRLELQATCFGYAMIAHDSSFTMTREVYDSFEPYLRAVIEDGIHGSKDSVATWGLRGLYSATLGNCNTWTATSSDVD